jgi:hypothetical protein
LVCVCVLDESKCHAARPVDRMITADVGVILMNEECGQVIIT